MKLSYAAVIWNTHTHTHGKCKIIFFFSYNFPSPCLSSPSFSPSLSRLAYGLFYERHKSRSCTRVWVGGTVRGTTQPCAINLIHVHCGSHERPRYTPRDQWFPLLPVIFPFLSFFTSLSLSFSVRVRSKYIAQLCDSRVPDGSNRSIDRSIVPALVRENFSGSIRASSCSGGWNSSIRSRSHFCEGTASRIGFALEK